MPDLDATLCLVATCVRPAAWWTTDHHGRAWWACAHHAPELAQLLGDVASNPEL